MRLLILLLASSGMVLASPRMKGLPLVHSRSSHSFQQPTVEIVPQPDAGDSDSVLVRVSAQDLQLFNIQQSGNPQVIPDAQFDIPSSPSFNTQPDDQTKHQARDHQNTPQVTQYNAAAKRRGSERKKRLQDSLVRSSINQVLRQSPTTAQLITTKPVIPALHDRLIDNYTTIIEQELQDTFTCDNLGYGYYADQDNNCQIFHVCVPLKQLYPANFTTEITYQFSFICPKHTIFSQDTLTCAWSEDALPCDLATELFWINRNFFRIKSKPDPDGSGEVYEYAQVNDPLYEDNQGDDGRILG